MRRSENENSKLKCRSIKENERQSKRTGKRETMEKSHDVELHIKRNGSHCHKNMGAISTGADCEDHNS